MNLIPPFSRLEGDPIKPVSEERITGDSPVSWNLAFSLRVFFWILQSIPILSSISVKTLEVVLLIDIPFWFVPSLKRPEINWSIKLVKFCPDKLIEASSNDSCILFARSATETFAIFWKSTLDDR